MAKPKKTREAVTYVIYVGADEVIVTTLAREAQVIEDYFKDPDDRDINDYDRQVSREIAVSLTAQLRIEW